MCVIIKNTINKQLKYYLVTTIMELLKTSKFIQSMFEEDINEGIINLKDIDFKQESKLLFDLFSSNKKLKIDYKIVDEFLINFDILYINNVFKSFKHPLVQEYFNKELNTLLLIDFILSFFRAINKTFDVKNINTMFIFNFFVKLGDFFSFMNYLDVDDNFVNYLKFMITLYCLQLERNVIDNNFQNSIEIIDYFFANEILPKVFEETKYTNTSDFVHKIKNFNELFEKELKSYNPNMNYTGHESDFLDNMFKLSYFHNTPSLAVKTTSVEVVNPRAAPVIVINHNEDIPTDYNSDGDSDGEYDDDGQWHTENWTPTIMKEIPNIEESDPNYNSYRMKVIFKGYQKLQNDYNNKVKAVRMMCSGMRINDYVDFLPDNNTREIVKAKTIIGIQLDFNTIDNFSAEDVYNIACEYGHFEIAKAYIELKNGDLIHTHIRKAAESPNKKILNYLKNKSETCKHLKDLFKGNSSNPYFLDPKIRFI